MSAFKSGESENEIEAGSNPHILDEMERMEMKSKTGVSRRNFMETTGKGVTTLAAVMSTAPAVLSARSPNEVIGAGCIGLGVRGGTLLKQATRVEGVTVTALCDVYQGHVQKGGEWCMDPDLPPYPA